jgi:cation diffusion facilitator family transporter
MNHNEKVSAAGLSVISNTVLVLGKVGVGLASGSVSVLSEGIHSAIDLVAALIALFSVQASSRPADEQHAYGHGKIENMSALVEGALVLVAALWIIFEAIYKLRGGHEAPSVTLGLWVMGLSAVVNWLVSAYLLRVAQAAQSMALEADAVHLRSDVWTSVGVFVGLLLVRLTGLAWLDAAVALLVAVMIMKAGWDLCRKALSPLIDARLPHLEEEQIIGLIREHEEDFVEFHDLRTRQAGAERHVDFHLVVHGRRSLAEVHQLCDQIEQAIEDRYPLTHVLIHPEPCDSSCDLCRGVRLRRDHLQVTPKRLTLQPREPRS